MRRREFITGLGTAAWPLAASAQQQEIPEIGVLSATARNADELGLFAFRQGLLQQGYTEDRNVRIQYSWADGHFDLLPSMAAEFVRRRVAVIATISGTASAVAAKAATSTIPIVFQLGADPVAAGLVKSLNQPGGNVTGVTSMTAELGKKGVELLQKLLPTVASVGFFTNPGNQSFSSAFVSEAKKAADALGVATHGIPVSSDGDIGVAFDKLVELRAGALLISNDPFFFIRREQIVRLAEQHRIPVIYSRSDFVKDGGLISYGTNIPEGYQRAGVYVARILNGEKPADLPVLQPTKFELVINLKTAKALGLTVPVFLLATADEIIE